MSQQQTQMPNDTWPITRDDKVEMQELGRKLTKFLRDHFADREKVHIKIVVGAFNYVMDVQTQQGKLLSDDFVLANKFVKSAGLDTMVEEPFDPGPEVVEKTIAERRAELQAALAELDAEEDVANASPTPTVDATPMEKASEGAETPATETSATGVSTKPEVAPEVAEDAPVAEEVKTAAAPAPTAEGPANG